MIEAYREDPGPQTLNAHRKYCYACATVLDARAELCVRCGVRQMAIPMQALMVSAAPPPPQVIVVGAEKSAGVAFFLGLFFGPLGMIYSTGIGAIVMFFVNLFVAVGTLGVGLVVTLPFCGLWAASAASEHNRKLRAPLMSPRS